MEREWWNDKIAYEIYPKSFQDANGDGIGDLKGVISRLDYLKYLGVDILWLCPVYRSPMVDQGYDISDYYAIAEEFGTMQDMEELIAETKKRGMYLIMDLVVNHCSDQHEWFQRALKDPEGEYADYFFFRKGKNGTTPNNMRSYFGGSAWEPVPGTKYYYLHMFAKQQPDLNWENPKLREEIYKMINWWMEKGLSGFRIDAIMNIKKDINFPDYPADLPDGTCICAKMPDSVTGLTGLLQDLKKNTFEKYNAFTVAELFGMKDGQLTQYIGKGGCFSTIFDFFVQELTLNEDYGKLGWCDLKPMSFSTWRDGLYHAQKKALGIGFMANILENHDQPRSANTRLSDSLRNEKGKKMLAAVYMCLRGIPFLYQGQEIGMENIRRDRIEEYDDISTIGEYQRALADGHSSEEALKACFENSRDNGRTPMQWNTRAHAGFTTGIPWLSENPNYKRINVEEQIDRKDSLLNFYRELIQLKKSDKWKEILTYGTFKPLCTEIENVICYERCSEDTSDEIQGRKIIVAANFGTDTVNIPIGELLGVKYKVLISNKEERIGSDTKGYISSDGMKNIENIKGGEVIVVGVE